MELKKSEMEQRNDGMGLEELRPQSLAEALKAMAVGETRRAPLDYSAQSVRKAVSELNATGEYVFISSTRSGVQTVTRLV